MADIAKILESCRVLILVTRLLGSWTRLDA
jgi:hypothetical protein